MGDSFVPRWKVVPASVRPPCGHIGPVAPCRPPGGRAVPRGSTRAGGHGSTASRHMPCPGQPRRDQAGRLLLPDGPRAHRHRGKGRTRRRPDGSPCMGDTFSVRARHGRKSRHAGEPPRVTPTFFVDVPASGPGRREPARGRGLKRTPRPRSRAHLDAHRTLSLSADIAADPHETNEACIPPGNRLMITHFAKSTDTLNHTIQGQHAPPSWFIACPEKIVEGSTHEGSVRYDPTSRGYAQEESVPQQEARRS
jgi:hypothetical protein